MARSVVGSNDTKASNMVKLKGLQTSNGRDAVAAARENGISMTALASRLHRGWSVDEAVYRPMCTRSAVKFRKGEDS